MAAVTQTANQYFSTGNLTVVTATFTTPADTNTWDTGLRQVFWVGLTAVEANLTPSDALSVASISDGTVTLDLEGTIDSALAIAFGV